MNTLDLLLIGAFLGLFLGAMILGQRPHIVVSTYQEDQPHSGCGSLLVVLLVLALLVMSLLSPAAGG
jgi:hypothetical protein